MNTSGNHSKLPSPINHKCDHPPEDYLKLNFDGASKGNPGEAGFGGIFRDHQGRPLLIYYGSIGWDTNNSAELEGLWQGLQLAQLNNFFPLEIEGDSQILINMAQKLLQGSPPSRGSDSWRLTAGLELIAHWMQQNKAIVLKHVKRSGNKVADLLANKGVTSDQIIFAGPLTNLNDRKILQDCTQLVHKDYSTPDAGEFC